MERTYDLVDNLLIGFDRGLRTVFGRPPDYGRATPGAELEDDSDAFSTDDRTLITGLLRVDHSGEVCAQALYQGQGVTARNPKIRAKLALASEEENDHLRWCEDRLIELGGRKSYLNPLWYVGSYGLGMLAGIAGDGWNLGFLAETERQVVTHLSGHLERLPAYDSKTAAVLAQMREDEGKHATTAIEAGGYALPEPIPRVMKLCSRVMTGLAYYI